MQLFRRSTECLSRADIPKMLERMGLTGEGAEIGVREGIYAKCILTGWPSCKRLHLVDPWCELPKEEYRDARAFDPEWEERCRRRMEPFGERVAFFHMNSQEAQQRFANHQTPVYRMHSTEIGLTLPAALSFVYIDANHAYEYVRSDCFNWWERLDANGVLAGHDIFSLSYPGVTQAVVEFAQSVGRTIHLVRGDFDANGKQVNAASFYMFKGGA